MPNNYKNIYIHHNYNKNQIKSVLLENAKLSDGSRPEPTIGSDRGLLFYDLEIDKILIWTGYYWKISRFLDDRDLESNNDIKLQDIWAKSRELETLSESNAQSTNDYVEYHPNITLEYISNSWEFTKSTIAHVVFPKEFADNSFIPTYFDPVLKTSTGDVINRYVGSLEIWRLTEFKRLDGTIGWKIIFFSGFPTGVSNTMPPKLTYYEYIGQRLDLSDISGGGSLTVQDYVTGLSYSNINHMIFRGNVVTVPGGTALGVLAESNNIPNSVTVWIPMPAYVNYFNQDNNVIPDLTTVDRKMSNGLYTYNQGTYNAGATHDTFSYIHTGTLTYSCVDFSVYNNTSGNLVASVYDADEITLIQSLTYSLIGTGSTTGNGITVDVYSFNEDNDRYKASVNFTFDLNNINLRGLGATISQNGGKYTIRMVHNNTGDPQYISVPKLQTAFYDLDTNDSLNSNAVISGTVGVTENTPVLKYISGIAYYNNNSTFNVVVANIDNLNDQTYPTDYHMRLDFSSSFGIPDDTKYENQLSNWSLNWNAQNLGYNGSHIITSTNLIHPSINSNNDLDSSTNQLTAYIKDWIEVDNEPSVIYDNLIWIKTSVSDRNTEDFHTETNRLNVSDLINSSNEVIYSSTQSLTTNNELQQIFGKLVYPKLNFNTYNPIINSTNITDYSTINSTGLTLSVIENMTTFATDNKNYSGYRWYVRRFDTIGITTTVANGIITFNTDMVELDLETKNVDTGTSSGNGNLLIFLGGTNDIVPTEWFDLSKDLSNGEYQGPRANSTGASSSNLDDNGEIAWDLQLYGAKWKFYLLIGIKSTATTKEINQIDINI